MDTLLQKFFENDRWAKAIETGVDKGINKEILRNLSTTEEKTKLLYALVNGQYRICPPHQAEIPKDDGTMRVVYVNEGIDRIFLSIVNDMLFEMMPEMIHSSCKSYQKGIGCGKVVQKISNIVVSANGIIGWKSDLSKYFDSVPIEYIDKAFDKVEAKYGKSVIIDVLRDYYHSDLCFDTEGNLIEHYQSLKQGCAVASWLADVVLYHIDEQLNEMNGYYVRYSDDCLFVGDDYELAMKVMSTELNKMQMKLNPKKVEYLVPDKWFKFLGFSIKGKIITLSKSRIKKFQHEIERLTIRNRNVNGKQALNNVIRYLYKGNGQYSWATQVLGIINSDTDIRIMNEFVMDCIRSCETGKKKVGGLGYENHENGVITRGIGKNVKANKAKTEKEISGYKSLMCMREALLDGVNIYRACCLNMGNRVQKYERTPMAADEFFSKVEELYHIYKYSLPSERSEKKRKMFYCVPLDELTIEQMCSGVQRELAQTELEEFVLSNMPEWNDKWGKWCYVGRDRNLVILKEWFE